MVIGAISVSQLVLNEIAWSPGDPGTGAPSFFRTAMLGLVPGMAFYCVFAFALAHGDEGTE
jgi:hypothetical protein